jgi:hypothetical protein
MIRLARLLLAAVVLPALGWGAALAADAREGDPGAILLSRPPLPIGDLPGETTLRLPLASERHALLGLPSPYLSLGSSTALGVPWNSTLPSSLRSDVDGPDRELRLGAGLALPLSPRTQIYGEYRFLRGRLDPGAGLGLLQREPDSADFRAGFSIRLN